MTRPLHVAIDGAALERDPGGARRYVSELLAAMTSLPEAPVLTVIGVGPSTPLPEGVRRRGGPGPRNNLLRTVWTVARDARGTGADVLHAPAYTAPLWGTPPVVLTLHDVSYERQPHWYPWRRDPVRRRFYRLSALGASRIITDSEFSKREIAAAYDVEPERIRVIPLAVGAAFTPEPAPRRAAPPYILHVGELHARRDVPVLLEAVALCRARTPGLQDLRLVLAGADRGGLAGIEARAHALQAVAALDVRGIVDEPTLLELYRRARAFAYASRYEGFGLPILEAMACGTPVVAADAPATREVAGDAAAIVPPGDPPALAAAIEAILTDASRAEALRAAGLERARQFTWRRTAESTLAVYREASARA